MIALRGGGGTGRGHATPATIPTASAPRAPRPTPRGADGAPIRVASDAIAADAREPGFWQRHRSAPIIGEPRTHDGTIVRDVHFVIPAGAGEAMIHINSLTDRHREDITAARFEQVSEDVLHVGYLLPEDLVASYRIVRADEIPRDVGRHRSGWKRIHEIGAPDPLCAESLPNPLGRRSSVLRMPRARSHAHWTQARASVPDGPHPRAHALSGGLWLLRGLEPVERLLILFDGEQWRACGVGPALAARAERGLAVLLVDSGTAAERSAFLPHPERVAQRVADEVLPAARAATGRDLPPHRVIAAGQSYGGLAAAGLAVLRPDLVGAAVAQSGSFHFTAGADPRPPADEPGDLLRRLEGVWAGGRVHVQAGSEEDELAVQSRWFATVATAAGMDVTHEEWAGGHDYAWWTDGLFAGLDALAD